jgi:hypothetical protein
MKTLIIALVAFGLGIGALYAYNNYQAMVQENKNLKMVVTVSPTTSTMTTVSPTTETPQVTTTGKISGTLGYPAEGIPLLTVYAFDTTNEKKYFLVNTQVNQGQFTIAGVEPGSYYVVAYAKDYQASGGYTKAVACGLSVDCKDHSLIAVTVKSGETASGAEVKDWYAPDGTFPKKP